MNFSRFFRRLLRFATWLGVGIVALLLLLAIGVVAYTRTSHFQQLLHDELLTVLRASLDADVTIDIEDVKGSLWQGVDIHRLSVRKDGMDVLSLTQGKVTMNVLQQLVSVVRTSSLQVVNVTLTDPVIRVVQDPKAGWNVLRLMKPAEPGQESTSTSFLPAILLPHLTIENGQVFVRLADGKELQLTEVTLDSDVALLPTGVRAQVKDLHFGVTGTGIPAVQWSSQLAYEGTTEAAKVTLQPIDIRTALSHVQLSGTIDNLSAPTLALTAAIEKLAAADVGMLAPSPYLQQDLTGSLQITGPLSSLEVNTTLETPDGRVAAAVTANLTQAPPEAHGRIQLSHIVLQQVLHTPGVDVAGEATGQVQFQGSDLQTLHAEAAAFVSGLAANGKQIGDVNLTTTLADGKAVLFSEINGNAGYLSAQGKFSVADPYTYDATILLRKLNAQKVTGAKETPLTNINVDVSVKGRGIDPETMATQAKLSFAPSTIGPTAITKGEFVGSLSNGQLTLEKGVLLANDLTVNMQGRVGGLRKTGNGNLTYRVRAQNLSPWLALAGLKGKGALDLDGTAEGNLKALRVDGKLSVTEVEVGANAVQAGAVSYQFAEVGSPQPRGHVTVQVNGVQAGISLKSVRADFDVAGLQPAVVQADANVEDSDSRVHHVKTQVRYASEQLDVLIQELSLQSPSGIWQAPQQPHLTLRNNTWTLERFVLTRAEQTVRAAGVFTPQGLVKAQLQVTRFSLGELRPLLGDDGPVVKGEVNVDVQVQGTMASPDVTANVSTGPLAVAQQQYAGLTAQGSYHQEQLALNMTLQQDQTHALHIQGGLPIALQGGKTGAPVIGNVDVRIHSDGLSLAFLEPLSREIRDVRGVVDMDVNVRGPTDALVPSGFVRLQQGNVRIRRLEQTFSDVVVNLQLEPTTLRLVQLMVHGGDGQLTGAGTVGLNGYNIKDFDLTFTAQRFRVISTREYRAGLSGQLSCSGSLEALMVKGAFTVLDTTVRPNLELMKSGPAQPDPTIIVVQQRGEEVSLGRNGKPESEAGKTEEKSAPGLYEKLTVDVRISIPANTWVQMREGSIELRGDLRVQKEPAQEIPLSGTVETVRGWVAVEGKKF